MNDKGLKIPERHGLTFYFQDKVVGHLTLDDGPITFEGNLEESGQVFVDWVIENIERWRAENGW